MLKWLLPAALLALSGCSKTGELDGFKDVKFGQTGQEVEALGFTCEADGECKLKAPALPVLVPDQPIAARLASADPTRGEAIFSKCKSCHTIDKGGANGIGPNLYAIIGEPIGGERGGFVSSGAMKARGGNWDFAALDALIANPKAFVPGTKMTFAGISNEAQRADLIAYLNTQGSNLPLPPATAELGNPTPSAEAANGPAFTLFGKSADVRPHLKSGQVASIDVTVALTNQEAIDLLRNEYGDPHSFDYEGLLGNRSRTTYWLFGNGASIAITDMLDEGFMGPTRLLRSSGIDVSDYIRNHTTVSYLNKSEAVALQNKAKGNAVDPNDT